MSPESFHVLVALDDAPLRQALLDSLADTGFVLEEAGSGAEALERIGLVRYDLVLLDLDGARGLDICKRIRAASPRLGIVMVRAGGAPEDGILALEAGADDCVSAPFRFREIVARLSAVLRRSPQENSRRSAILRAGVLEVDVRRRVCHRAGKRVHLSPKEFDLLVVLMKNAGVALPHIKLLRAVWGSESSRDFMYLRSYVKALRKKLEADP